MLICLRSWRPVWNWTVPSTSAKRVQSRPTPTFRPGWYLVPHWRTRMFPARTNWPPNRFTPRRCPAESRPLRDEPPAFLCAIISLLAPVSRAVTVIRSSGGSGLNDADLFDFDPCEQLAVAFLQTLALTSDLLEDD